jgi:hypothetical protein
VLLNGRRTPKGFLFVTSMPQRREESAGLSERFQEYKKSRVSSNSLSEVEHCQVGTKGSFRAVVRTFSIQPVYMDGGTVKRSMSVVDMAGVSVDVSVWDDGAKKKVSVGAVVEFEGAVSAYNKRSLNVKELTIVEDKKMSEWWEEHAYDEFRELSEQKPSAE